MRGASLELVEGLNMEGTHYRLIDIPVDPILQHMVDKYPRLFHGSTPRAHSCVEPGWKALVDDLCLRIDGMLTDEQSRMFTVRQIKDKLGTPRFYFSFDSALGEALVEGDSKVMPETGFDESGVRTADVAGKIRAAIEEAIGCSNTTCSVCSQPGRMHHLDGLLSVRCDEHSAVR